MMNSDSGKQPLLDEREALLQANGYRPVATFQQLLDEQRAAKVIKFARELGLQGDEPEVQAVIQRAKQANSR